MKNWQFITLIGLMVAIIALNLATFRGLNARIDSLHLRIDSSSAEIAARIDSLNSEVTNVKSYLSDRIDVVNQRIDRLYGLMQPK